MADIFHALDVDMEVDNANLASSSSAAVSNCVQSDFRTPSKRDAEKTYANWDPLNSPDWGNGPKPLCLARVKRDIEAARRSPTPGISIFPLEENLTKMLGQITGPADTPYAGICFQFMLRVHPDYPFQPPRIRFLDADNLPVRVSPHFYLNGRVCLSVIGTWPGPQWSAGCSIPGLLISLQSILSALPLAQDPVFGPQTPVEETEFYNRIVRHECLRNFLNLVDKEIVTENAEVEAMIDADSPARMNLRKPLVQNYVNFLHSCQQHLRSPFDKESFSKYSESSWHSHFIRDLQGSTNWTALMNRLNAVRQKVLDKYPNTDWE